MSVNLENSAVATGPEKVVLIPISKKGNVNYVQTMIELHYFTCWQGYAQNPLSYTQAVHEPRTFRCTNWI